MQKGDSKTPSRTHTKTIYEKNQTVVSSTDKADTDSEGRGHVKGDDSSNLQPLGVKDVEGHDVQMVRE